MEFSFIWQWGYSSSRGVYMNVINCPAIIVSWWWWWLSVAVVVGWELLNLINGIKLNGITASKQKQ